MSQNIKLTGLLAYATLASKQYTPVKFATTAGYIVQATATTDRIIGIVQNDPAAGEAAEIAVLGEAFAIAGTSNLAVGEAISANSSGVLDVVAGYVCGYAAEASSAVGDRVKVVLTGVRPY